jgi:hypothetical protein
MLVSAQPDDLQYMSLTERLSVVRRHLDSLVQARLVEPLDPASEHTYQALCCQEQELLKAIGVRLG